MRITGVAIAVLAMMSTAGASRAGDGAPTWVRNWTWWQGTSGHGYANAPELAGQRHQYIENQLLDFHNHVRDNPFSQQYMWGAAANLNAQTARDLAVYFSLLPPKPANDGVGELAAIGREIYLEGIPEINIVPCAACHGPNAEDCQQIAPSTTRSAPQSCAADERRPGTAAPFAAMVRISDRTPFQPSWRATSLRASATFSSFSTTPTMTTRFALISNGIAALMARTASVVSFQHTMIVSVSAGVGEGPAISTGRPEPMINCSRKSAGSPFADLALAKNTSDGGSNLNALT